MKEKEDERRYGPLTLDPENVGVKYSPTVGLLMDGGSSGINIDLMFWEGGIERRDDARALALARRVIACMNACAGIPTDQLNAGIVAELILKAVVAASAAGKDWLTMQLYLARALDKLPNELTTLADGQFQSEVNRFAEEWNAAIEEKKAGAQ